MGCLSPNQITAHNAGWPSQFRFAGHVFWSGVCEFYRCWNTNAMRSVTPISDTVGRDKERWKIVGRRILAYYSCSETISEVGRCIDCWKKDRRVPEGEMIDGLGFLLGELVIAQHGGMWVWVVDDFGQAPAVQRSPESWITYVLDAISKRLRDDSVAEREIPSVVDAHVQIS